MEILEIVITLGMLVLLQAVLGFDNLLYISLESKRAPEAQQSTVRKWGIGIAVGLRVVLLFLLIKMISAFQAEWFQISWKGVIEGSFNLHCIIVLVGGVFIMYTAMKEIFHMTVVEDFQTEVKRDASSAKSVVAKIVFMNAVFSFDSILSAIGLVSDSGAEAGELLPLDEPLVHLLQDALAIADGDEPPRDRGRMLGLHTRGGSSPSAVVSAS